jgi:ABC-type transport system involved in multi-copper enzyme maturation permease subunit
MRNPLHTPFAAVFCNEVLLSTKRVAPYALILLFAANKVLWWARGPAVGLGWATNSDFNIKRDFTGFCFLLGLPIFNAIIMGDPVVRDFRLGVDPLIFSKPVGRASYLLAKFLGNFFVLVCCQSAFAITALLLQWVPYPGMVVLPVRVVPFIEHFIIIVVISHLVLGAVYFAAGTITRNAKVVWGLAACFYPAYIAFELLFIKNLPLAFRVLLDPLGFNTHQLGTIDPWKASPEFLNQWVVSYGLVGYTNRVSMIVISAVILLIVYRRFTIESLSDSSEPFTKLTLSSASERVAYADPSGLSVNSPIHEWTAGDRVPLPKVTLDRGPAATRFKILAAVDTEFRLLRAERSLIVLVALVLLLSFINLPPHWMVPEVSYSVMFASETAKTTLFLLAGLIVFYTGEAMHRDRELKVEPMVWPTPIPNSVLLLSKFLAMASFAFLFLMAVGVMGIVMQVLKGLPLDLTAYFLVYSVVAMPGIIFMIALVVALNVLLRNKYLAYIFATGLGAGLIYLYNLGYNHWLYNPLLYRLWKYSDLTTPKMLGYRLYCLGLAALCLALAHFFFKRQSK